MYGIVYRNVIMIYYVIYEASVFFSILFVLTAGNINFKYCFIFSCILDLNLKNIKYLQIFKCVHNVIYALFSCFSCVTSQPSLMFDQEIDQSLGCLQCDIIF